MFPSMLRAVREARPRAAVVENVGGLLKGEARAYFDRAIARLRGFGYEVAWRLVKFANHGVPQRRERVIIVALRAGLAGWEWPAPTHAEDALLWAQWGDGSYWREHGLAAPEDPPAGLDLERLERLARAPALRRWRTVRDVVAPGAPDPDFEPRRDIGIVEVHRLDAPAWTVTASHWNNKLLKLDGGLRYLTVEECARLQTFPDGWPFAGRDDDARLKQIGNAVPPAGAAAIMGAVRDALG